MPVERLRGEPALYECPGCHQHHGSVARIEGLPVLPCPTITEPGRLVLRCQPPSRRSMPIAFLVGPEPEPEPVAEPAPVAEEAPAVEVPERRQRRSA